MSYNKDIGKKGEKLAARYLKKHGFSILAQNYIVKGSELDIIAEKNGEIHFVEVKTRTPASFGNPADAVNYPKRKAIIHGAKMYLMRNQKYYDRIISFDICEVILHKRIFNNKEINYIENAFDGGI